jgi:DNA-binding ferritin-like protein (oxidative damage protectant)
MEIPAEFEQLKQVTKLARNSTPDVDGVPSPPVTRHIAPDSPNSANLGKVVSVRGAVVKTDSRALSTFGREARNTINEADELDDADTADLFTEISRGIDKWLWFVEAHPRQQNSGRVPHHIISQRPSFPNA